MDRISGRTAGGDRGGSDPGGRAGPGGPAGPGGGTHQDGMGHNGLAAARGSAGPAPESRKANLSLLLGAAGLVLGFLLLFAILTPAAIFAAVGALREIRLQPSLRGRWKAWAGIGLAVVSPILWVSAFLAFAENGTFGIF